MRIPRRGFYRWLALAGALQSSGTRLVGNTCLRGHCSFLAHALPGSLIMPRTCLKPVHVQEYSITTRMWFPAVCKYHQQPLKVNTCTQAIFAYLGYAHTRNVPLLELCFCQGLCRMLGACVFATQGPPSGVRSDCILAFLVSSTFLLPRFVPWSNFGPI